MRNPRAVALAASIILVAVSGRAIAEGDPNRGARVYGVCAACHSLEPGVHLSGPSLAGLWGKKAASIEDFTRYSKALKKADIVWDENTLNAWLALPESLVPGTYMVFRGIENDRVRGDLIAFLRLALAPDGGKSVVAKGLIPAEVAKGQVPEPVASVGPQQRVIGIRHCRDTYFVATADGAERPYWELNVRLKTDTGKTGPQKGKPVLLPAGMQGDRVSIVFADPAEIGRLVEKSCSP
ncbi:MAG: cytochrome c family protein [Hyphomicrobiaceae bacterium]|nr:MAG: cytochrome c family protein [Hyphomicrobiaceae bacterium]